MRRLLTVITFAIAAGSVLPAAAQDRRPPRDPREKPEPREQQRQQREERRDSRSEQTDRFTRTLNIGPDGEIDVVNISGNVTVTRANGNSATIEVTKVGRGSAQDDAKTAMGLVNVDIVERGTRVEVRTRYPESDGRRNWRNWSVDVHYAIAAPANTRIIVKSISGDITLRDIAGSVTLEAVSGTIRLANVGRLANAKTISGDVDLTDTRVEGALEAGSISGTVRVRRTTARSLELNTVSGEVLIEDVSAPRVEGQSVSGTVRFMGDLEPNGRYEFTSHSGDVRLALGGKTGFQIEATSFSGAINTELPLSLQGGQGRNRVNRSVRGTFGDGSATLEITAFSGSIQITKR